MRRRSLAAWAWAPVVAAFVSACSAFQGPSPGGAATASAGGSSAESSAGVAWEVLGEAPFERIEAAATAHDGEIWVAGGLNADGSASAETWRHDPAGGTWTAGPDLPDPVHHAAMVSTGDGLLLIGGYRGPSFSLPQDAVLRLTDAGDGWVEDVPLPQARAAGAAAWDGTRIVYAGGVGGGGAVSDAVLALEDGRWAAIGSMVAPREHLSAASDGEGRVWLLGGRTLTLDTNVATVEYVEGAVVARVAELPTARGGAVAFHLPGIGACLAGGEQPSNALDEVECIDDGLDVVRLPDLATARHGHAVAVLDGSVYVLLGGPEPLLTVSGTVQRLVQSGADG
jgi:hypothetical protein